MSIAFNDTETMRNASPGGSAETSLLFYRWDQKNDKTNSSFCRLAKEYLKKLH